MTLGRIMAAMAMATVLAVSAPALGQAMPVPTPTPTASTQPAVPSIGDVLKVVEKASATKGEAGGDWSAPVKLALVFTGLALLPALLVMVTSFTRIIIVLSFVRRALTTQSIPPTVALIGLAMFLTLYTMSPTFARINEQAAQPYLQDKINLETACLRGNNILKEFMVRQIQSNPSDLEFFVKLANIPRPATVNDLPSYVAIPAFAISEFRKAFEMGCLLFIPFLIVDLVISAILLSAGMMMLPPSMISLPFKIVLFVLVDGWKLLAATLVGGFRY